MAVQGRRLKASHCLNERRLDRTFCHFTGGGIYEPLNFGRNGFAFG
jgi:hypothetical protein